MGLHTGFDLHSSNTYVGIIDEDGKRLWKKKLRNDPNLISSTLKPFKEDFQGIVVESTDAFWLAEMLRLKILPEGYIYSKEQRPLRDLLRKRGHLVRLRTSLIQSLQNILARNIGARMHPNHMKALRTDHVTPLLAGNDDLALAGKVSKDAIDALTTDQGNRGCCGKENRHQEAV